uniref:Myocilin opposite strand n=1 Tax=Oryctolagus cuniculus TaxID=9986 RepID=A0A5F9DNR1_RABIT
MAQKSLKNKSVTFPYEDLASEVTRRRVTMTTREEVFSTDRDATLEMLLYSQSDSEEAVPACTAYLGVPPAPPPSPAKNPTDS